MTLEEFKRLTGPAVIKPTVTPGDLANVRDRTLLYGYTVERNTWHVFLREWRIELVLYYGSNLSQRSTIYRHKRALWFEAEELVPSKRLYPEACDFEFCHLLESKGVRLPYTTFNALREPRQFHGLVPPLPGGPDEEFDLFPRTEG